MDLAATRLAAAPARHDDYSINSVMAGAIREPTSLPIRTDRLFLYQTALIYRLLRPTAPSVFNRDVWQKAICNHFDTQPALIVNRVKGYIDFPSDAAVSPLWV